MTSHDKSTRISQCCNQDCNQGRDCPLMQEEIAAGAGALLWCIAAAVVCVVTVFLVWVTG